MPRRTFMIALALLTLTLPALGGLPVFGGGAASTPPAPELLPGAYADADGNGVFDALDAELAAAPAGWAEDVVVVLRVEPTPSVLAELKSRAGGFTLTSAKDHPSAAEGRPWAVVPAFSAVLTKAQVGALAEHPLVRHVEPGGRLRLDASSSLSAAGVSHAWTDFGVTGDRDGDPRRYTPDDVVICIVDTGVDNRHVDLDGGKVIGWKDFVEGNPVPYDDNGHGTHVAGIAAGEGDGDPARRGVAPGAALVVARILALEPGGPLAGLPKVGRQTALDGLDFCYRNREKLGVDVMNLSWGFEECGDGTNVLARAVDTLWDAGIVVVKSAGNEGPETCTVTTPGDARGIVTVGRASDPSSGPSCSRFLGPGYGWHLGPSSSRGPTADGRVKPDVIAPGTCVRAPLVGSGAGYVAKTGTSMAAPFVAGVVALMLDAAPHLTPDEVRDRLHRTAEPWGHADAPGPLRSHEYGAGMLRAHEAVEAACACGDLPAPPRADHHHVEGTLAGPGSAHEWVVDVTDVRAPFAATLIVPAAVTDGLNFTLTLLAPDGSVVQEGYKLYGTHHRSSIIGEHLGKRGPGEYVLRVESHQGSGTYDLDISAGAPWVRMVVR